LSKYGAFVYRGSFYGEIPRLPFSVEPFQAVAVDYDKVILSWGPPQGAVNGLRLVRNQVGFGEWPEDGIILLDVSNESGNFGDGFYIDGEYNLEDDSVENNVPLIPGRFVYYKMWLRRSDTNLWAPAEGSVVVLPREHGTVGPDGETFISTHDSVMDLLPRVYTSESQTPLDPVDTSSDLYTFLKPLSFTIDEFLTLTDLLLPDYSGLSTNPALLDLQAAELGLTLEDTELIIRQKRMVREALYTYARKGTLAGVAVLIESLTGFAPVISTSPNLFLSNQDSTFNESLGSWVVRGAANLSLGFDINPPSGEDLAIEKDYSAKVVVSAAESKITNGREEPITRGIPVISGTEYSFSFYARSLSGEAIVGVIPEVVWHDSGGNVLSTVLGSTTNTTVSWAKYSVTAEAPGRDFIITQYTVANNVVTATTDGAHILNEGDAVKVVNLGIPFDGNYTLSSVTSNTVTFTIPTTVPNATVTNLNAVVAVASAVYASVGVKFSSVGTVYLDLMQFADSSVIVFNEARGVDILLLPNKSNYINNPSYSGITQEWSIAGGTATYPADTAPYLYSGDTMLSVSATGPVTISDVTNTGGMPTGEYYSFSTYVQSPTRNENLYLRIVAVDSVNPSVTFNGAVTNVGTEWVRLVVTGYLPASYVSDGLFFTVSIKCDAPTTGSIINLEAAQLEASFAPTLYIDGSFPPEFGVVWEGTSGNSPSHLYKNKLQKTIRLIQELEKFLPSNTPYVVRSLGGIETTAITM
jgi:hypothetical protein